MARLSRAWPLFLLVPIVLVAAQGQNCYIGPGGAISRAPENVVPCLNDGNSACCLQGDTCLSGNACFNYKTGTTYQYGCTDITYQDETCPFKCGFNTTKSPWTAMEICDDVPGITDTWVCHAPESCGCEWNASWTMVNLTKRGCKAMGSEARVALHAPPKLVPYVLLPSTAGGSTGYWLMTTISGTTTWSDLPLDNYTPSSIGPFTTYSNLPTAIEQVRANATPSPSTAGTVKADTPTTSTSTSPPSSPTPTSSVPTLSSTTPSATPSHSPSGLSTGAKVGIGVGIAGGACGITALIIATLLLRKRRNASATSQQTQQVTYPYNPSPASPPTYDKSTWQQQTIPSPYSAPSPQQTPFGLPEQVGYHEVEAWEQAAKVEGAGHVELPGETGVHELSSEVKPVEAPSPSPEHSEVNLPRK